MKPEELLDPAKLPEDLQWVVAQFRLQPKDPVFLLIAWHWHRTLAGEDTLRRALMELKAGLDGRIDSLAEAAETVAGVNDGLQEVQAALAERPAQMAELLEAELRQPLATALAKVRELETALLPLARSFQTAQHRQLLAALLIGVALGVLAAVIALWP